MVTAAKGKRGGGAEAKADGAVGKVKAALAKATQAVTGLVKKDSPADAAPASAAAHGPSERSLKMKAAVEAARKDKAKDKAKDKDKDEVKAKDKDKDKD